MAKEVLVSFNFNGNEIQNTVLHPLAVTPATPNTGQVYFNTVSERLFIFFNGAWNDITGNVQSVTSPTPALQVNNTDPANPELTIADADGTNSGLLTSAFFNDLTNATDANVASTLVKRDASGNIAVDEITASVVTGLNAPVNANDVATKGYVDGLVQSGLKILGSIDASTNPNYPAAVVGDAYHISADGLIGGASGESVSQGDLLVCVVDTAAGNEATSGGNWIIMEENLNQATETTVGYSRKATTAEALAGTETDAYITPTTLAAVTASFGTGTTDKAVAVIGDGTNLSFAVTHNFNSQYCHVQVFDAVSNEEVITEVTLTDANTATVTFAEAPTVNQYRAVVIG